MAATSRSLPNKPIHLTPSGQLTAGTQQWVAGGAFLRDTAMPSFTVECEYPMLFRNTVTVEASNPIEACHAAIDVANQSDAWKGIDCEQPTWITSLAEGDDVKTWTLTEKGFDTSVLTVPPAFTDIARLAGYAATRTNALIEQLRALIDAIGDDGIVHVDTSEIMRLRTAGQDLLDEISRRGLTTVPASTDDPERAAA